MALRHSPKLITDGLVLHLDPANPKNFNLSEVEALVVAGGGGGGSHHGGGGGAGGLLYSKNYAVTPGVSIPVTVGAGGTGGTYSPNANGGNGANSVFGNLTAIGGGGGATYPNNGNAGGSGGGPNNWSIGSAGGAGTAGQGFSAATNNGTTNYGGGGGGAGSSSAGQYRNAGGNGLFFPQFSSVAGSPAGWFAGGGGSGTYPGYNQHETPEPLGGVGGGGTGGNGPHNGGTNPTAGVAGTGGGGGGVADLGKNGAAGGSGIVIVRYPGQQKAIGGTVTISQGYTYHVFSTVGSFTFTPLVATNNSAVSGIPDLSGQNNFGTSLGSPTFSNSNGGNIVFDGADDYINLKSASLLPVGTSDRTIIAFVRTPTSFSESYLHVIHWGTAAQDQSFGLAIFSNGGLNTHPWNGAPSQGTVNTNTDYCLAVSYTHSSTLHKFWINGVSQGAGVSRAINTGTTEANIGSRISGPIEDWGPNGKIYNIQVYNRALSDAEILQNFNALRGRYGL